MTREDIIQMARQAANSVGSTVTPDLFGVTQIERFAVLVAAAERERLSRVRDERANAFAQLLADAFCEQEEKSRPDHSDYVLGDHWLEAAYQRVCAGEDEAVVMADYGWRQCAEGQRTTQHCGLVEAAVAAEREACAQEVCERAGWSGFARYLATCIRARGEKA
jgi:hypothetical protein